LAAIKPGLATMGFKAGLGHGSALSMRKLTPEW
jgi:hypothetical protein